MMAFCALPLLVFALVWLLMPHAVAFCRKKDLHAPTTDRHIHTTPTPHGGGFILPLICVPAGLATVWFFHLPFADYLSVILLTSLPVAWVGWLDDHFHVAPRIRLAVHLLAVGLGLVLLPQLFDFMPIIVEKLLLLLAWGWFVNLYNFMDGADGLAASEAIIISLALALFVPPLAPLALLIAAAAGGFLRSNFPPAKVFMGDVSSTWLGYILGGLLLVGCADDTWTMIWPLATITLVFSLDATTTLIRRIATGHAPWHPHKTFWFHRYLSLGHSHQQLLKAVGIMNVLMVLCAALGLAIKVPTSGFLAGILVFTLMACYIRRQEGQLKGPKQGEINHHDAT